MNCEGFSAHCSSLVAADIDIMKVIEVLAVEPSKDEHATSKKASTVAPPSLWGLPIDL